MPVQPIPAGYNTVTAYLVMQGAAAAIEFYKNAFDAVELFRIEGPGGTIGHAEIKIGDSVLMMADECPQMGHRGPKSLGATPVSFMIYLENVDARFERALKAGGKQIRPIANQFYGDRSGMLEDPFGHVWTLATHVEDVPPGEMAQRAEKFMKEQKKECTHLAERDEYTPS